MSEPGKTHDLLLVAATERELPKLGPSTYGVATLVTGPGPIHAAAALGRFLAENSARLVVNVGIGGAFPESGLTPGDLAVATLESDADFGVEPAEPGMAPGPLGAGGFSSGPYPADAESSRILLACALKSANATLGPFVTSATVTATARRAGNLRVAYGAICESMEGAACAHAALQAGARFAEIRAISNLVGPRDRQSWKIDEALASLHAALALFLKNFSVDGRR